MKELGELAEILRAQQILYQKILRLEEKKTVALLKRQMRPLGILMGTQQGLMMKANVLEEKRMALCGKIGYPTLRALVESGPESREALGEIYELLRDTMFSLKGAVEKNKMLLETKLTTIRYMNERLCIGKVTYSKKDGIRG